MKAGSDGNESWTGYNYRKLVSLTPYQGWQSVEDYPIIRYAEVLLTYAEARVQNNGWDEKVQHALNDLRDRCGMPNVPNSLSKMRLLSWYAMSVVLSWQPKVIVTMIYVVTDWNIVVRR